MVDFYAQVPKTLEENLAYRLRLRRRAIGDVGFQRAVLAACKHDVLYWLNAWAWIYEPRPRFDEHGHLLPKMIPFITWPHQDPIIREVKAALGIRDIGIEKSRGEGMSWIGILLALHDWLFDDMAKVGLVSNNEKKADDPGNMDSLGAKLDWELQKLPKWMAGVKDTDFKRNLSDHSWVNHRNGSQINAFAATSDAGRAGRYKWFLADELAFWDRPQDAKFLASIRGSTDCRLAISTPNGSEGAYYQLMHAPSNALRLRMHWSQNPTKNRGLYKFENGKPVAVDPVNNPLPANYDPPTQDILDLFSRLRHKGFVLENGRLRSPWYDGECDRADSDPKSIAQELDIDYGGSAYKIFGAEFFAEASKGVRPPFSRGNLSYHPRTLEPEFDETEDGPFLLWTKLDHRNRPAPHVYVVAADISSGLGGSWTSNSTIEVINSITMEQVAEFACNTVQPSDWADTAIATAKWFHDAYLIWEHNGPGAGFTKRILEQKYPNIFMRTVLFKRGKKKTKEAGWWTDDRTKEAMFGELLRSVRKKELVLRSDLLVKECQQYVRANGKIEPEHRVRADDSSRGAAHGDRVIGIAVCLQGVRDRPLGSNPEKYMEDNPPPFSMAARQREYEAGLAAQDAVWDDRTNWEMTRAR